MIWKKIICAMCKKECDKKAWVQIYCSKCRIKVDLELRNKYVPKGKQEVKNRKIKTPQLNGVFL